MCRSGVDGIWRSGGLWNFPGGVCVDAPALQGHCGKASSRSRHDPVTPFVILFLNPRIGFVRSVSRNTFHGREPEPHGGFASQLRPAFPVTRCSRKNVSTAFERIPLRMTVLCCVPLSGRTWRYQISVRLNSGSFNGAAAVAADPESAAGAAATPAEPAGVCAVRQEVPVGPADPSAWGADRY